MTYLNFINLEGVDMCHRSEPSRHKGLPVLDTEMVASDNYNTYYTPPEKYTLVQALGKCSKESGANKSAG